MRPFVTPFSAVVLASAALAQNILIAEPTENANVTAGSSITVKLDKPMTLTGSTEVAVVIGVTSCTSPYKCPDVTEVLGEVLYSGPYAPELYDDSWNPYQNFTVAVPSGYSGVVQLGVVHFFLLAAGPSGQMQFTTTTLNVID